MEIASQYIELPAFTYTKVYDDYVMLTIPRDFVNTYTFLMSSSLGHFQIDSIEHVMLPENLDNGIIWVGVVVFGMEMTGKSRVNTEEILRKDFCIGFSGQKKEHRYWFSHNDGVKARAKGVDIAIPSVPFEQYWNEKICHKVL